MLHTLLDRSRRDKDQQICASVSDSRPSQRTRRTGHPSVLVMPTRSKAWATRPQMETYVRARRRVFRKVYHSAQQMKKELALALRFAIP